MEFFRELWKRVLEFLNDVEEELGKKSRETLRSGLSEFDSFEGWK